MEVNNKNILILKFGLNGDDSKDEYWIAEKCKIDVYDVKKKISDATMKLVDKYADHIVGIK